MKKIYLLVFTGLLSASAFSQVKWGAQVIGNLSSAHITGLEEDEEEFVKRKSIFAYGVGVSAEVALGKEFTLRPSLNLLKKGVQLDINFSEPSIGYREEINFRTSLYYAELPLNLTFNGPLKSGKYFIGFGPSFGLGLFGKAKTEATYQDPGQAPYSESEEIDAFKSEDEDGAGFKRFEVSGNIIAGLQWNNGLYVNAGYLVGLTSTLPTDDGGSYKNKGLQLTLGMFFGKK
ncbi:MAG TPA: outer membrane beta-barrel protein [Flavisolibacter sp.]|jgi:hypothetical protein